MDLDLKKSVKARRGTSDSETAKALIAVLQEALGRLEQVERGAGEKSAETENGGPRSPVRQPIAEFDQD